MDYYYNIFNMKTCQYEFEFSHHIEWLHKICQYLYKSSSNRTEIFMSSCIIYFE